MIEEEADLGSGGEDALIADGQSLAPKVRRRTKAVVGISAIAMLSVVTYVTKKAMTPANVCAPEATDVQAAVKLFEEEHENLGLHNILEKGDDPELVRQWLIQRRTGQLQLRELEDEAKKEKSPIPSPMTAAALKEDAVKELKEEKEKEKDNVKDGKIDRGEELLFDAMEDLTPDEEQVHEGESENEKAKDATDSLSNLLTKTSEDRKDLKKYMEDQRKQNLTARLGHVPSARYSGGPRYQIQKHYLASCVINVLQATTFAAEYAMDIHDALKTCPRFKLGVDSKIACLANGGLIFEAMAFMAATLGLAASDCAATIVPNVDSLCAAGISALIGQIGSMGGGAALAAVSCSKRSILRRMPPQVRPSNLGTGNILGAEARRLELISQYQALNGNQTLPGRSLIVGGGVASNAGHCAVDILEVMWWLGMFAIAVNDGANKHVLAKCPPRNIFGGQSPKDIVYETLQSYCTFAIGGAIFTFGQAIAFLQLAIVHCPDYLNENALCGAGVTLALAGMSGIAGSAGAIHIACDMFQKSIPHAVLGGLRSWDDWTDGSITKIVGSNLGRRLEMAKTFEEGINQQKERFGTPYNLFKHLGYDLDAKNASWVGTSSSFYKDFLNMAAQPKTQDAKDFHDKVVERQTCSAA